MLLSVSGDSHSSYSGVDPDDDDDDDGDDDDDNDDDDDDDDSHYPFKEVETLDLRHQYHTLLYLI